MMPAELRPNWKRKLNATGSSKAAKVVNIEETLKALEQKEKTSKTGTKADDEKDSENVCFSTFSSISSHFFNIQKCFCRKSIY